MSGVASDEPVYRRMTVDDIDALMLIETDVHAHPWTGGNFSDSIGAGYHCWVRELRRCVAGYAIITIAAGESHLLNLSIARCLHRKGLGACFTRFLLRLAHDYAANRMFLEVRPSNEPARALYVREGFVEIGRRRGYYPAGPGREDAIVMERPLP